MDTHKIFDHLKHFRWGFEPLIFVTHLVTVYDFVQDTAHRPMDILALHKYTYLVFGKKLKITLMDEYFDHVLRFAGGLKNSFH